MVQQGFFLITKNITQDSPTARPIFLLTHKMILLKKHFNTVLRSTLPLK
jgi:hypothetical protein